MLDKTSDGPPFELVFHCIVIPLDIAPERSSSVFKDAAEEEEAFKQQCMIETRFDEIGHHLIFNFQ